MLELIKIINLVAIFQGLFLGLILFFRKENKPANKIFALLLCAMSVSMSMNLFKMMGWPLITYYLVLVNVSFYLLYGPLIYLYTVSLTEGLEKPAVRSLAHFVPCAAFMLFLAVRHPLLPGDADLDLSPCFNRESIFSYLNAVIAFLFVILLYIMKSLLVVADYRKKLKIYFSDVHKLNLLWLSIMLSIASVFVLLLIIQLAFYRGPGRSPLKEVIGISIFITFLAVTFTATYFTIRYPEIFSAMDLREKTPKYEKHRIDDETRKTYLTQLLDFMETEKPYLNDSLKLRDLAEMIRIPPHYLTIILNMDVRRNFYTFVNEYRVAESKRKLIDPSCREMNILTIAYNSGFNSKSTFNTIFREITGMTPSEFRQNT